MIVDRVSDPDVSEWDEWIFVVRNRIGGFRTVPREATF